MCVYMALTTDIDENLTGFQASVPMPPATANDQTP